MCQFFNRPLEAGVKEKHFTINYYVKRFNLAQKNQKQCIYSQGSILFFIFNALLPNYGSFVWIYECIRTH